MKPRAALIACEVLYLTLAIAGCIWYTYQPFPFVIFAMLMAYFAIWVEYQILYGLSVLLGTGVMTNDDYTYITKIVFLSCFLPTLITMMFSGIGIGVGWWGDEV